VKSGEEEETKFRGIKVETRRIHERKPKTITNRLRQKSISLPRIDDEKRWAGYPGLAGTARQIAKLIPKCKTFVEPFAGTAKVYQMLPKTKYKKAVLNDMSTFIYGWLNEQFPEATITNEDFVDCVKRWDAPDTVFLFDAPWNKSYYDQSFSFFNRKTVREYNEDIIELCNTLKGKFIITTRKECREMGAANFNHKLIESEYVVSGHYPRVLATSNMFKKEDPKFEGLKK
jgi:site-specific DNA-adenine methylase